MVRQFVDAIIAHRLELGIIISVGFVLLLIVGYIVAKQSDRVVRMDEEDRSR